MPYILFAILVVAPGYLLLRVFQNKDWGFVKTFVFSVALSLVIIMTWGLLVNTILPILGYGMPLSRISLIISFGLLGVILLAVNLRYRSIVYSSIHLTHKLYIFLPLIFPVMSIIGIQLMNSMGNNILLLALLISVPVYVVYLFTQRTKLPEHVYLVTILCIGASLLLLVPLRNPHIIGDDVLREYGLFLRFSNNGIWHITHDAMLSSSLSINLLPTIVRQLTGMDSVYVFKGLLFVVMFCTPFVVYYIAKRFIGIAGAFIAAFFVMAQTRFLGIGGGRTEFAVFFFATMILVLMDDKIIKKAKIALFACMSVGIVFSHYTTAFITMFLLAGAYVLEKLISRWNKTNSQLPFYYLGIFFVPLYLWEGVVNTASWDGLKQTMSNTAHYLYSMVFSGALHSGVSDSAMGTSLVQKTVIQRLAFFASFPLDIVIVLALMIIILKRKSIFNPLFLSAAISGVVVMVVAVVFPVLSTAYSVGRAYYQMSPIFAPFIGIVAISKSRLLLGIVLGSLVLLFLFNSNVINQFIGQSKGLILNSSGEQYERYFIK